MIHKIDRLISIGKFRNYQAAGDVAFKKLTLIYADNGSGKTTISAIFRSLSENDPSRITKRISTGSAVSQAVVIVQRTLAGTNITHAFGTAGWRSNYPDIEVFDTHFVDENVYSGSEFNEEHKKQLHQFVVGAQGVSIQQQLDQNKTDKATAKGAIAVLENKISAGVGNGLMSPVPAQFLNLKPAQANNIDQKIAVALAAVASANANSLIQTLAVLQNQSPISLAIDFEALARDLSATVQSLQDEALRELFKEHTKNLTEHGVASSETWLKTGFRYLELSHTDDNTDMCPFCTQELPSTLEIIKAYTELFNVEFNALVNRLDGYVKVLETVNIALQVQRISNVGKENSSRVNSWATYLPGSVQVPVTSVITDELELGVAITGLIQVVSQKARTPSLVVDQGPLETFLAILKGINVAVTDHNAAVTVYNQAIAVFRSGIQTVVQAEGVLSELKRIKLRFDASISVLCGELLNEKQKLRNLEADYTLLSASQQAAAQVFFSTYKDRINHYLGYVFRTSFAISDVARVAPQGKATQSKISYRLTMDGQGISFDAAQQHNVKDCLSEGDKSTIALAFFLSKLDIDPGKADKVLIFDDPLSSFDSNRRMYTVQLIKDLLGTLKQVVVLSHNEYFLHEISKTVGAATKKILRINQNFTTNSAFLVEFDLARHVENSYFKHVKKLESFLSNPDIDQKDEVLGTLRNVLEAHIRFKFYRQLRTIPANEQTFGKVITTLVSSGVVFRDPDGQQVIDKLKMINVVSCKPHHGEPEPEFSAIGVDPATMNITELCGFVNDTIALIDDRL